MFARATKLIFTATKLQNHNCVFNRATLVTIMQPITWNAKRTTEITEPGGAVLGSWFGVFSEEGDSALRVIEASRILHWISWPSEVLSTVYRSFVHTETWWLARARASGSVNFVLGCMLLMTICIVVTSLSLFAVCISCLLRNLTIWFGHLCAKMLIKLRKSAIS